ncbi:MAG: two-component regulator propeller domain-containing protein [Cytophagaceae bacterium]
MKNILLNFSILFSAAITTSNAQFLIYNSDNTEMNLDKVSCISIAHDQTKWIGTEGSGLYRLDEFGSENFTTINTSGFPNNTITDIFVYGAEVWIATRFNGMGRYFNSNWSTINRSSTSNVLPFNWVTGIVIDKEKVLYSGVYAGGIYSDSLTIGVTKVYNSTNTPELGSNIIRTVYIDDQNTLWIGTQGGGLVSFKDKVWTSFTTTNSGIPNDNVNTIHKTGNKIWVGTDAGFASYQVSTGWEVFNSNTLEFFTNDTVRCFTSRGGDLYAATFSGFVYNKNNEGWKVSNSLNSNLPGDKLLDIAVDPVTDDIWLVVKDKGLAVINRTKVHVNDQDFFSGINIYPNPADHNLFIRNPDGHALMFQIKDIAGGNHGVNVHQTASGYLLDVSTLCKGMYFLQVTCNGKSENRKIFISR